VLLLVGNDADSMPYAMRHHLAQATTPHSVNGRAARDTTVEDGDYASPRDRLLGERYRLWYAAN
jgi:hypothetical protein